MIDPAVKLICEEQLERRSWLKEGRLVHYTSAESAYRIIKSKMIWLRNAAMMNDFSEIDHGIKCLVNAWRSPAGISFQNLLDRLQSGLRRRLEDLFNGHSFGFRTQTYISCLSEHENCEDELGRLSMWRAYGGSSVVALVLNTAAFEGENYAIGAYSSPVMYLGEADFVTYFESWVRRLESRETELRMIPAQTIEHILFSVFRDFALSTKHPGFREEREWRIFHSPLMEGASEWLESSTEIVRQIPQKLIKLHLRDNGSAGVTGAAPNVLLNRVIIGPCEHPLQIKEGICEALDYAGVQNVDSKVWMSLIPLRHAY